MIFYGAIDAAAAAGGDVWVGVIFVLGFATALIFALSLHEMSHALAAKINGDLTAAMYGRLSLNPMRHFDPVGLVMMLLVGFGWARPVPVDPRNFKNYRKGMLDVALAGFLRFMRRYSGTILLALILLGFVSDSFFGIDLSPVTLYITHVGGWITSALKWLWGLLGLNLPL